MHKNINFTIPENLVTKNFIYGVRLILQYQPNSRIAIGKDDTIYFGDEGNIEMSKKDKELMFSWDWYEKEESWAINV